MARKKAYTGGGYMRLYRSIAYSKVLTPMDKLLWCVITDKCDYAEAFHRTDSESMTKISISALATDLGVSRNTVLRSLDRLTQLGIVIRQYSMIQGAPDGYMIPPQRIVDAILNREEGSKPCD